MEYCFQVEEVGEHVSSGGGHIGQMSRYLLTARGPDTRYHNPLTQGTERLDFHVQEYESGGYTPDGAHEDSEQAYMILEGRMRAKVEGKEYLAGPGSVIYVPRNARHEYVNATEGGGKLKFLFMNIVCT